LILDPGGAEANASTPGIVENYRLSRLACVASLCGLADQEDKGWMK
jgi:hypothetical protein